MQNRYDNNYNCIRISIAMIMIIVPYDHHYHRAYDLHLDQHLQ